MTLTLLSVRDDGKAYLRDAQGTVWSTRPPYDVELRAMLPDAQLPVPEALETFATWDDAIASLCRRVNIKSPRDREKAAWEAKRTGRRALVALLEDYNLAVAQDIVEETQIVQRILLWITLHGEWLAEVWPEFGERCAARPFAEEYSEPEFHRVQKQLEDVAEWLALNLPTWLEDELCP